MRLGAEQLKVPSWTVGQMDSRDAKEVCGGVSRSEGDLTCNAKGD